MPVKIKKVGMKDSERQSPQVGRPAHGAASYVCSVDLGINNAATASILGKDGTVTRSSSTQLETYDDA